MAARLSAALFAACALLAGGCIPMRWEKVGLETGVVDTDLTECRREAYLIASREVWLFDPFPAGFIGRDRYGRPIFVHRYWRGSDRFLREQSLVDWCMRLKGYRLVPVPPERALSPKQAIP